MSLYFSRSPFEDPDVADHVGEYAWEDLIAELDKVAQEMGFGSYGEVMTDFGLRSAVQARALQRETRQMVRRFFEAGNGLLTEMDAIVLTSQLCRIRGYFECTPRETFQDRGLEWRKDFEEESKTFAGRLGDLKLKAIRSTVEALRQDCYLGEQSGMGSVRREERAQVQVHTVRVEPPKKKTRSFFSFSKAGEA